jgi:hypothetical protein
MVAVFYAAFPSLQRRWRMVPTPPRFLLYQRDDCHLCDLALAVLADARMPDFQSVFIDEDTVLESVYGARVPVLRDSARGTELDWPFDVSTVAALRVESPVGRSVEPFSKPG